MYALSLPVKVTRKRLVAFYGKIANACVIELIFFMQYSLELHEEYYKAISLTTIKYVFIIPLSLLVVKHENSEARAQLQSTCSEFAKLL